MGTISSQFCITSIVDGMTIHGSLWSDKSLTQYMDAEGAAVPKWDTNTGPTIWLTVLKGIQEVSPIDYTWYYNGQEITDDPAWAAMFVRREQAGEHGVVVPTLKIIRDLATPGNRDLDVITLKGRIESNGTPVEFSASIEVRICALSGSGYGAVFHFPDGGAINDAGEHIRIVAGLVKDISELTADFPGQAGQYTVEWYVNYDEQVTQSSQQAAASYYGKSKASPGDASWKPCLWLYEGDVTDKTVVRCVFKDLEGNVLYWDTVEVDDEQDPDQLYIMYDTDTVDDGSPVSLHRGQTVNLKFWVATGDDHKNLVKNGRYTTYKAMLLKADGSALTQGTGGWVTLREEGDTIVVKAGVATGSVTMKRQTVTVEDAALSGGTCTVGYEAVTGCGGTITGLIKAE